MKSFQTTLLALFCAATFSLSAQRADPNFNPGYQDGSLGITQLLAQPDEQIYATGGFNFIGGKPRVCLARLGTNGVADPAFNPGFSGSSTVFDIVQQRDGRLLVAGGFTNFAGMNKAWMVRLTYDGNFDPTFNVGGSGPDNFVTKVLLQPDGKIVIGGAFTNYNGTFRRKVARLNADGSVDTSFNPGNGIVDGTASISALALQTDGRLLVGGTFTNVNGTTSTNLARFNTNGTVDTTFKFFFTGSGSVVRAIAVQPDGKIVIGGRFTAVNGQTAGGIARLNADGSTDIFNLGPGVSSSDTVRALRLQPDGGILVGGTFSIISANSRPGMARLKADGSLDTGFSPQPPLNYSFSTFTPAAATAIELQRDGGILFGGTIVMTSGSNGRTNILHFPWTASTNTAPAIVQQPISQSVVVGETMAFVVNASGYPLSYQWQMNGTNLPGVTNAILSFSNVTASVVGSYSVQVSNNLAVVQSDTVDLTVSETAPFFVAQPIDINTTDGTTTNLAVLARGLPSYQWFYNGNPLTNKTAPSLSWSPIGATNSGPYYVVASNQWGTATSRVAQVNVIGIIPTVTTHPASATVLTGTKLTLTAAAFGAPSPSYQWLRNGTNLATATTTTLIIYPASTNDIASYSVIASNYIGAVTSQVAVVNVIPEATVSGSWYFPSSLVWKSGGQVAWATQTTNTYDGGDAAQSGAISSDQDSYIETQVNGPKLLSFFWKVSSYTNFNYFSFYVDGVLQSSISGEVNWSPMTLSVLAGQHTLRWKFSRVTSIDGFQAYLDNVNFVDPTVPVITSQPVDLSMLQAGYGSLSVTAAGADQLFYQWRLNGVDVPGATNSVLAFTNFQSSQAGTYTVFITNSLDSVLSSNAVVTMRSIAQSAAATLLWKKLAGSVPWLPVEVNHSYRGIAYNPATTNVLVVSRQPNTAVYVLNGETGDELRALQMSSNIIKGGTYDLNMITVADDGVVYAANLTQTSDSVPFKIYRWDDDSTNSIPTLAWSGNPGGAGGAIRWGDSMSIRGAGTNTQIIVGAGINASGIGQVAIISPSQGTNSPTQTYVVPYELQPINVAFGDGDTFWTKGFARSLRKYSFNATTNVLLKTYSQPSAALAFAIHNPDHKFAGIFRDSPDYVQLWNFDDNTMTPRDTRLFGDPYDYDNSFAVGSVSFGPSRVYAIDANNGIIAMKLEPTIHTQVTNSSLTISWSGNFVLQSAVNVEGPYTDVIGATNPYAVPASEQKSFFRLRE